MKPQIDDQENQGARGESARTKLTDDQLLAMRPAKDAGPDEWREYYRILSEAGKLTPPASAKD